MRHFHVSGQTARHQGKALSHMQAEAAEIKDGDLDHATSHLGKAVGITQLLRGTVYHAQRRRVYLPTDLMSQEGVTEDQLTRGEPSAELNNVVYEVASTAKVSNAGQTLALLHVSLTHEQSQFITAQLHEDGPGGQACCSSHCKARQGQSRLCPAMYHAQSMLGTAGTSG